MSDYDVVVIGAGPGGYVAAIRAAQLGLKTAIIEKERIGGLCLNWGCIPSKALLQSAELINLFKRAPEFGISYSNLEADLGKAVDRSREVVDLLVGGIETLLKQNKVTLIEGTAQLTGPTSVHVSPGDQDLEAANIIIATGGATRSLPGVSIDGDRVFSSRDALELRERPQSIVIAGGGAIGVEFAYLYRSYGAEVTVVELLDHLLPNEDEDVSRQLERSFAAQGIALRLNAEVKAVTPRATDVTVTISRDGQTEALTAERALIGVGFAANSAGLGLEAAGVETERGWIKVDNYCRTSVPSVWAVGDVTGKLLLAHVASHQGVTAVEKIAGLDPPPLDYSRMPRAVYCQPQVASLGLTEEQALALGIEVRSARFPFRANSKAVVTGETEGFVKLVANWQTKQLIGYHIVGHNATEILGEAALGSLLETQAGDLGYAVHAHPTLSEAMKEAALALHGEAVHFYSPQGKRGA
jgi:dihydrolipoamide dehydrogenase